MNFLKPHIFTHDINHINTFIRKIRNLLNALNNKWNFIQGWKLIPLILNIWHLATEYLVILGNDVDSKIIQYICEYVKKNKPMQ